MSVFVGAEHIISPLADGAKENFDSIFEGNSGVKEHKSVGIQEENLFVSKFDSTPNLSDLISGSIKKSLENYNWKNNDRSLLILSTTKGDINLLKDNKVKEAKLSNLTEQVAKNIGFKGKTITLSNACISGVLALVQGFDYIKAGLYDEVVVCGGDLASLFTISGFQSFFAISSGPCQPFDKNRKGINLGEGAGTLILSKDNNQFTETPLELLGGSSANDANHISGPSRTGEGLFRSIQKTLSAGNVQPSQIGFLSAHGTATAYNDEMESIAFDRSELNHVPVNSMKGYFGHTLGAAGIFECAMTMQGLRQQKIVASAGFQEKGVSGNVQILSESKSHKHEYALKTASGFGGCNASALFKING